MTERPERRGATVSQPGDAILARLAETRAPALLIDPARAALIAANDAGRAALGFETEFSEPVTLDSAMPAVADLRRIAERGAGPGKAVSLVFWTPDSVSRLDCRVEVVGEPDARRVLLTCDAPDARFGTPEKEKAAAAPDTAELPTKTAESAARHARPPQTIAADVRAPSEVLREFPRGAKPRPPEAAAKPQGRASQRTADRSQGTAAPAAPAASPPQQQLLSDGDVLKAIARQILAGRAAAARPEHPAPPKEPPSRATVSPAEQREDLPPAPSADARPVSRNPPPTQRDTLPPMHVSQPGTAEDGTAPAATDQAPPVSPRRELVRRIAHELKSPIGAIMTAAELMKDERFGSIGDERYLRYARDIHESARHALAVVERMLGTKIAEDRAPDLSFTEIDIAQLIASVASSMELLAADAGLVITTQLPARLPRVIADATSVRQILLNVLTNAIKFTPREGRIDVSAVSNPGHGLAIVVRDTGPGMTSAQIDSVSRAQVSGPSQQRPGGGYGIGLPLARDLAKANGADLGLTATPGRGTIVTIRFPDSRLILV